MEEITNFINKNQNNFKDIKSHEVFDMLKKLKEKAELGDIYYQDLKNEVIKLSSVVQPDVNLMIMKSITEKLSIEELKSFRDSFKSRLAKMVPAKPQFSNNINNINNINNLDETESQEKYKYSQFQI